MTLSELVAGLEKEEARLYAEYKTLSNKFEAIQLSMK